MEPFTGFNPPKSQEQLERFLAEKTHIDNPRRKRGIKRYGIGKRNSDQPHNKGIADHAESGITACADKADQNTHIARFKRITAS